MKKRRQTESPHQTTGAETTKEKRCSREHFPEVARLAVQRYLNVLREIRSFQCFKSDLYDKSWVIAWVLALSSIQNGFPSVPDT
jgi:hypothetical protein